MKKLLSFFLALVLVLGLCGSFASAAEDETAEEAAITEEEAAPVTDGASNGWVKQSGSWYYYQNGAKATGWKQVSGTWYYFNASGVMQTGWQKIGGTWYYLKSSGAMATGWVQMTPSWSYGYSFWYYFKSGGALATGWQKIGGTWYYFDDNGLQYNDDPSYCYMVYDAPAQSGSKWYLLGSNGAMITKTGWHSVDFEKGGIQWFYVLNSSGELASGWQKIGGTWYYFYEDGMMVKNDSCEINGSVYLFNSSGAWVHKTGWIKMTYTDWEDGSAYTYWYYSKNGSTAVTGWQKIDGTWYYFYADGMMAMGQVVSGRYAVNSSGAWVQNGWVKVNDGYDWVYAENGYIVTGDKTINGTEYHFGSSSGILGEYSIDDAERY